MSTFTYDVTDDIGKLRLQVGDYDLDTITGDRKDWSCIFTDEELQIFLDRQDGDIILAAAEVLIAIAGDRSKLARKITISDYSEDMSQVAKDLRAQAKYLIEYNDSRPADDFSETADNSIAYQELLNKQSVRG